MVDKTTWNNIHKTIYGWHCCTPPCRIQLASLVPRLSLPLAWWKIKTVFIFLSARGESIGTRLYWSGLTAFILIRIIYDKLFHQFSTSNLNLFVTPSYNVVYPWSLVCSVCAAATIYPGTMSIFVLYSMKQACSWSSSANTHCALLQVADHQEVNKMTPQNLATVFGPNLIWSTNETASLTLLGEAITFSDILISNFHKIFTK